MIVVIPCGAKKRPGRHPAFRLYEGPYFHACLAWALSVAPHGSILILSAKHGLLPLQEPVQSYNLKMGNPGSVTAEQVRGQARTRGILGEQVVALGGKLYTSVCRDVWPNCVTPLEGVGGIGKQLAWMKHNRGKLP